MLLGPLLINIQVSKVISAAYLPKGTRCVPFRKEKSQGRFDFKGHLCGLSAKRDIVCSFREGKAPGQI